VLHDDFLDDGEAKAGAAGFGSEEGVKEFAQRGRGNAGTVVEDEDALEWGVVGRLSFAAEDNAAAVGGVGAGFGGVADEIEERLAEEALVAVHTTELAFGAEADLRVGFADFGYDAFDGGFEGDGLVRNLERPGVFEEFSDDVSDVMSLLEDFGSGVSDVTDSGFGLDHLRVAGDGGQRVFEFMGDAGGEFAESGEILLELDLLLEGGELGQVAEQADSAVDIAFSFADRRDGNAEVADVARGRMVLDFFAAEDFAGGKAFGDEACELGLFAESFGVAAEVEGANAERLFSGGRGGVGEVRGGGGRRGG